MGEINRQGGSYDSNSFLVLVGVSRPLYDIIFYFQTVLYIPTTSFSHVDLDVIYCMFFVEYSVVLSLGRITISCFLLR